MEMIFDMGACDMKLTLNNIGVVKEANINLKGITVIAGKNDTGKSTSGKVLYSLFKSLYKLSEQIRNERATSIETALINIYIIFDELDCKFMEDLVDDFLDNREHYLDNLSKIEHCIYEKLNVQNISVINEREKAEICIVADRVHKSLLIEDEDIILTILTRFLKKEFNNQVNNIYDNLSGEMVLQIKDRVIRVQISNHEVFNIDNVFELNHEVIYIDDPFVLDNIEEQERIRPTMYYNHRTHLMKQLNLQEGNVVDELINANKLENIYKTLNSAIPGDLVQKQPGKLGYIKQGTSEILDIRNVSTGLKTFAIVKTLLLNGTIAYNGTIVLDEPEIHLNPDWQILLAELIVMLQKEFNLHILLNTHSPYFLNAIEVYAKKHNIKEVCNYYLTEMTNEGAILKDVSKDTSPIYDILSNAFQILEDEEYADD